MPAKDKGSELFVCWVFDLPRSMAGCSPHAADLLRQRAGGERAAVGRPGVGSSAVLPDGGAGGGKCSGVAAVASGQQRAGEAGEYVASAGGGKARAAAGVDARSALRRGDDGATAFEGDGAGMARGFQRVRGEDGGQA